MADSKFFPQTETAFRLREMRFETETV